MSRVTDDLGQQFQQLTGPLKFGVIGLAFIVAFLAWDATLGELRRQWVIETMDLEEEIAEARAGEALEREFLRLRSTIITTGLVDPPSSQEEASNALSRAWNDIRERYASDLREDTYRAGLGGRLPEAALAGAIDDRVEEVLGTLEFETTPEVAAAIVRDLERSPDIESISELRLTRLGSGRVKVRLELEAWALSPQDEA